MTLTIKLNNLVVRIILVAAGLFVVLFVARVLVSHFLLRNIADPRIVMSREVMNSAAMRQPDSPRILLRLAGAEIEEPASEASGLPVAHALKAANLSPWDYRNWRLLAMSEDAGGKLDEAVRAMRIAGKLAPNSSEAHWALANLLIRQNNRPEALKAFQTATKSSNDLLPAAMDVVWQAFDNDIEALNSLVRNNPTSRMLMAQFMLEQDQADAAIEVFQGIDGNAKLNSQNAPLFISLLVQSGRGGDARRLWAELVGVSGQGGSQNAQGGRDGLIWNGGFETSAPKNFGHFDWEIKPSDYARIGFDRNVFRQGQKSLRLNFAGRDTTKLLGEIQQTVVLSANRKYRLECFARSANFVTPEGPRIALLAQKGIVAVSEPVAAGSTDWQHLVVEFTAPNESAAAQVAIIRIPRFDYDEPTKGTVWFDDFRLTEL